MCAKLSETEVQEALASLKGWETHGDMLVRSWQFHSFQRTFEFVGQIATIAERMSQYPDVVLSYRNVRVEISTHEAGGLTSRDFDIARTRRSADRTLTGLSVGHWSRFRTSRPRLTWCELSEFRLWEIKDAVGRLPAFVFL